MHNCLARLRPTLTSLLLAASTAWGGGKASKPIVTEEDRWELRLSMPAWIAGVDGETGINGNVSESHIDFKDVAPRLDMAAALRFEARKGRFGIYGEAAYLSLSDGKETKSIVKKLDAREDQLTADLGLSWRVLDGERGFLEVIGGVRYTNTYLEVQLQGNDQRIGEVSRRLAAAPVAGAVLARQLREARGRDRIFTGPSLTAQVSDEARQAIDRIRGNVAEREERIERRLRRDLNRRITRVDDWWDPYVGVRCRYHLSDKYYLLGRADIGGFGVGSEITWQASGGIGCKLDKNTFFEITYRALAADYEDNGLLSDLITHGPEISLGKIF
jgi:hypothetical protein